MTEKQRKAKVMKTLKSTKKCDAACKRYIKNLNQKFSNRITPYKPSKKENEKNYQDCRRLYCNEPCNGVLVYGTKEEKDEFQKNINNSFHKNFTRKRIKELKKRGALSGCTGFDDKLI
jgi:hypothetical protein